MSDPQRPRGPGFTFTAASVVLITLLAALALTARQPPPPTIAEFAPQSVENITDAPSDQSFSGTGGAGPPPSPAPEPGGAPSAETIDVPRVRKCVGDPPRQIDDPQSPPCVPYWSGDNGGATYRGVTRDQIKIAADKADAALIKFFNKRFEFYGRQLHLAGEAGNKAGSDADAAVNRAAAANTDEVLGAFAGLPDDANDGHYHDEMARRRLISLEYRAFFEETWLGARDPYLWEYMMAADDLFAAFARWGCSRLVGAPARYTGDALLQSKPRSFGMIFHPTEGNPLSTEPFERAFRQCGATLKTKVTFNSNESVPNGILQLKTDGVTSVFCLCNVTGTGLFQKSATSQTYFPEWLLSSYQFNDESWYMQTLDGDRGQLEHSFGISVQPREWAPRDTPPWWATNEIDPAVAENDSRNGILASTRIQFYRKMLLLASGIQMAGPRLTPETFQRALHRTKFPNPDTHLIAGHVGFNDADHSMTDDAVEWWWSNTDKGAYNESAGAFCYLDGAARRRPNTWPSGDEPFFKRPCNGE